MTWMGLAPALAVPRPRLISYGKVRGEFMRWRTWLAIGIQYVRR
jgi:hypothetical protein